MNTKRNVKNQTKENQERVGRNTAASNSLDILFSKIKDHTFSEILDDWKWILTYSARYKKEILIYILLGVLSTSLGLVSSIASKYLIDIITGYQTSKLAILIAVMIGGSLASLFLESVTKKVSMEMSIYIHNDIQADIFDKIMDADWGQMNQYEHGDILNRFNGDVQTISSNAISWIPTVILSLYKFLATFFVLLYYDWIMAFIALGSAPFLFLMSRFLLKKQREYSQKVREMSSNLMTYEVEAFYNYDTIKSFGVMDHYSKKMRWWQGEYRDVSLKYNSFVIKTNILMSVMGMAVQFVAFFYCLFRLWNHGITYGTMTLFLQQRTSLSSAFNQVISVIPAFLNSSVSAGRIREITELPREVRLTESHHMDSLAENGFEVRMSDVEFSYQEGTKVLKNTSFMACPGEIVALVGPSGEGKTTMLRLILGLVQPQQGSAVVASALGTEVSLNADTRHFFSYVPQGNTILNGTILSNLQMVKEDATIEEMEEALKIACAWEFVEKMPDGIYSKVGEKGRGLSEGQAQRVAIARAILRDAPILLLDEATSALDVATERMVLKNIITQKPNKTCIVTTHRPSVLNMCQRVYQVSDRTLTEMSEEAAGRMAMDF